jgi:Ribbon-helix-helix domain
MDDTVRWSLKVSRETDEALRAYLGRTGGRKGDLSKFVQEAVRAKLKDWKPVARRGSPAARAPERAGLGEALAEIREKTRTLSQARFERLVSEAVAYARKRR